MQKPFISHYSGLSSDIGATIPFNPPKRKWSSVISNSDSPTTFDDAFLSQIGQRARYDAEDNPHKVYGASSSIIKSQRFPTLDLEDTGSRTRSNSSSQTPTRVICPNMLLQSPRIPEEVKAQSSPSFSLIVDVLASEMMIVKNNVFHSMHTKLHEGGRKWQIAEQFSSFIYQQTHRERSKYQTSPDQRVFVSPELLYSKDTATRNAVEFYCLLVSFITVYVSFLEVSTALMASKESLAFLLSPLHAIMECFHSADNIFHRASDDLYLWYYVEQQRFSTSVTSVISKELQFLNFTVEKAHHAEVILSSFYTNHLLKISAQRHQKDHGQFYTPPSVVEFMWKTCVTDDSHWISNVLQSRCPSVLDPCMGTGSFLSNYIQRSVQCLQENVVPWNDADSIERMIYSMCSNIWGIEIDHFVFQLGKLNVMLHIFPLCCRWMRIKRRPLNFQLPRLHLFCNDILTLSLPQPISDSNLWEYEQLTKLRNPSALKFDFMVTNPPYMIRKTGFISMPDKSLYDMSLIGGRGTQAYMYFMWICLQRCHPAHGKLCFITPSQWILLEFAKNLRSWLWNNYVLELVYQFEPYKVWPKIQTDSLIFRLRPRFSAEVYPPFTLFLRHADRSLSLEQILGEYRSFDTQCPSKHPRVSYKVTSAAIEKLFGVKDYSFSFLAPTSSVADKMALLTNDFPRICGLNNTEAGQQPPLIWNRGPNTNPVYALLVRTEWALKEFGTDAVAKWMRPAIYWNGKCDNNGQRQSESKEILFWKDKDPKRVSQKENSPAEAYLPFRFEDLATEDQHYSMVLIDSTNAAILEETEGVEHALYRYLKEAREKLQPKQTDKKTAWCQYRQCGIEYPVKIVHPINFGYFSRSQPRQRFFLDTQRQCVTNQCMYFTIQPKEEVQDPLFYLGILNSTTVQFFITIHCCYDQQGRTRFFAKNMANIPYPPPSSPILVSLMSNLVLRMTNVRSMVYNVARELRMKVLIEKLRQGRWDLDCTESCVKSNHKQASPPSVVATQWKELQPQNDIDVVRICPNKNICSCLRVASLLQYAIDQLSYLLYGIPIDIQLAVETELSIDAFTAFESVFPRQNATTTDWYEKIMQYSDLILQNVDLVNIVT